MNIPRLYIYIYGGIGWIGLGVGGKDVRSRSGCRFPAMYNFGDSNSDTGGGFAAFGPVPTPNGDNFFHKPAGRGGDGRLPVDLIGNITLV